VTVTDAAPVQPEVFPPTLREVLLRPRWLGLLALCLVVAGVFAWLGQWQLGRAIQVNPVAPGATEQVEPIADVVKPGAYLPDPLVGQKVSVSGAWIPGDFIVVSSRFNDDVQGYWVTGQFRLDEASSGSTTPTSLAVAVGWVATREEADAAASALSTHVENDPLARFELTGRLISDEGTAVPPRGADPMELTRMSPAALLSRWHDTAGLDVYRPYLTSAEPLDGLTAISSPAPVEGSGVNWLNIFYAVEWAVFAGFAFYLWYRLAKDAWEREVEALEEDA
jgi:cytochrome oxidase assembly protein ShyY1